MACRLGEILCTITVCSARLKKYSKSGVEGLAQLVSY